MLQVNVIVCRLVDSGRIVVEKGKHPTVSELRHSFCIDNSIGDLFLVKGQMLLVIGLTNSISKHCLLLRSYVEPGLNNVCANLRSQIMSSLMKRSGIEAVRRGGSSGCAKPTETFLAFRKSGAFPRRESGVKFVAGIKEWTAIYVRPFEFERRAASYTYGQPQIGGVVCRPEDLVKQHEALQWFVLFKMQAPEILLSIDPFISPSAVEAQIEQNNVSAEKSSTLLEQIVCVSKMNNFTYVQHPVGYHIDSFKDKKPVLENKICFVDDSIKESTGRGGAGKSKFVWALLDW